MKKYYLLLLPTVLSALISCQKDLGILGQGVTTPKSEVFIKSITLRNFPLNDWVPSSVPTFDSLDSVGPDIYFYLYHKSDVGPLMTFKQSTHFSNVLPLSPDSPLVYYFTEPFQILPYYFDSTFYLTMYDLDYAVINDSIYMDSIPFVIGPDKSHPDNPYITSVDSIGINGSRVTLGLEWK